MSTSLAQWVILAGIGFMGFGGGNQVILLIGIALFAVSTLFSLITLPVEYDASARALKWMEATNLTTRYEHDKAADALKWAAHLPRSSACLSCPIALFYHDISRP